MSEIIVVPFQGEQIRCTTGLDAVAVKFAEGVLSGCDFVDDAELRRLAAVMEKYNRPVAAQRLRAQAGRAHVAALGG
jgi:hypothetical protein